MGEGRGKTEICRKMFPRQRTAVAGGPESVTRSVEYAMRKAKSVHQVGAKKVGESGRLRERKRESERVGERAVLRGAGGQWMPAC